MSKRNIITAYIGIILYAIAPILSVIIAGTIANANGARLDEANAYPCIIWGFDIGGILAFMCVMGWFMLVTIPTGVLGLIGLTIALISQNTGDTINEKTTRKDGFAVISFVLSITSIILGPLSALPSIVLGYVAINKIKKNPEITGIRLAKNGILISSLALLIWILMKII